MKESAPFSIQGLRNILKRHLARVIKIPKRGEWGQCGKCSRLSLIKQGEVNAIQFQHLLQARSRHQLSQQTQRQIAARREQQARNYPETLAMIGFDYTRDSEFPRRNPPIRQFKQKDRFVIKIGVLMNFSTRQNWLFMHSDTLKKGTNSIATLLYFHARAIRLSRGSVSHADRLLCQVDGGSENVNFGVIALCALMVYHGWFKQVCALCLTFCRSSLLARWLRTRMAPWTGNFVR